MADELRFNLVLDDKASGTLDKVKSGLDNAHSSSESLGKSMLGWVRDFSVHWGAIAFDRAIGAVHHLGEEMIGAAVAHDKEVKALTGVMLMTDKTGASYMEMRGQASEMKEELVDLAIKTGNMSEDVVGAYEDIAARSDKPKEAIKDLVAEMAQAGKAVPGGIGALTQGFESFQMGVIRARNPLVMLIKASGVMQGSAREIAKELTKAGPEKAMQAGEMAITRMSAKMKGLPPSLSGIVNSMKDMKEEMLESAGVPLLEAIVPHLKKAKDFFVEHRKEFEKWAKHSVEVVGEWVTKAAKLLKEGFEFLDTHSKEIEEALTMGATVLKNVFEFALDHKAELIAIWAATKIPGLPSGGAAGGATAAAGAGVGFAIDQAMKLFEETEGLSTEAERDLTAQMKELARAYKAGDKDNPRTKALEAQVMAATEKEKGFHPLGPAIGEDKASAARAMIDNMRVERERFLNNLDHWQHGMHMLTMAVEDEGLGGRLAMDEYRNSAQSISEAFNEYAKVHDEGTELQIARMLLDGNAINQSFVNFSKLTDEGATELMRVLDVLGPEVSKKLKTMIDEGAAERKKSDKNLKAGGMTMNVGSMNIKQDFRDQDPDRIAAIFQQDVLRAVEQRKSSRLTSVLGF